MKTTTMAAFGKCVLALALAGLTASAADVKKVLVVTTTTGFRHGSIATAERILAKLAQESGAFTVEFVRQPLEPQKPAAPKETADDATRDKYKAELAKYEAEMERIKASEGDLQTRMKKSLSKLSPENLKNYDGVIFANTTGDLPLPDNQGFIDWVKDGHAFVAMHSGSDTFHNFRPYIEMLGGEFQTHGAQASVDSLNKDKSHPATKHLDDPFSIYDEIYIIKSYEPANVHELLVLDKHPNTKEPGHYAVAWCKQFGSGKIFYTSLGHREDVWDPAEKNRKNSPAVAEAYQKHILGGIKWALGLEPGDATPQAK